MGDFDGISYIVKEYGGIFNYDVAAVRVEKGDMLGAISVYTSLSRPSTTDYILVSTQTYTVPKKGSKTVYFYVSKEGDYVGSTFPWSEWSNKNWSWLYENGNLVDVRYDWNGISGNVKRLVYKYVK